MTITTQQARLRFTMIPSRLQDAMFSTQIDEAMQGVIQQYHLDDMKAGIVGKIAGWVLLGFVHAEDMPKEIQEQLKLSPQIAGEISKSLDSKIFGPLKEDLRVAYTLAASERESASPQVVQEVKPPQTPAPAPKPPGPQIISESFSASPKFAATTSATPPPAPVPQKPKPNDTGWSTRGPQNPVVTLGAITPAVPSPAKTPAANPTAPVGQKPNTAPGMKSMSEFERLGITQKNNASTAAASASMPTSITTPTAAQTARPATPPLPSTPPMPPKAPGFGSSPTTPAPVMLQQNSSASAQSPGFHVNQGMQNQMGGSGTRPTGPAKPAILEFGNAPIPTPPRPAAAQSAGYRPPMPPTSQVDTGPRQVTEITRQPAVSPSAPAAMPPRPPAPPSPANAPQSQEKVIVKDFLGPEK